MLHLHALLWIKHGLTPQEVRDRILDENSDFQTRLVQYIESVQKGEFYTGTMATVAVRAREEEASPNYQCPTLCLPEKAPAPCEPHFSNESETECLKCTTSNSWWSNVFQKVVDIILFRSNRHSCEKGGCKTNKLHNCKARFPRDTYLESSIDPDTGSLRLRKGEAWLNTFSPILTFLMRCNTDVTNLLSGTAIKAVIAYTTDYIIKPGLQTHVMFDAVKTVFEK
ncbi:uncharacterized protein STEHIDRAFT_56961, partial [Stereum hirsutum FP-91666 SS1]|uniref:uncharacterized protein n=1 Tax=Stereum hirsutum (strain FP-91666) TaxID=721885 RepID=UPI0004410582